MANDLSGNAKMLWSLDNYESSLHFNQDHCPSRPSGSSVRFSEQRQVENFASLARDGQSRIDTAFPPVF